MAVKMDNIFLAGDDAMASQYEIIFPEGIPGGGNGERISLRMNKEFTMPEETWYTYEVFYQGVKIPKKGMLQETAKDSMTVSVRVDQEWKVFDDIRNWAQLTYNQNTGEGGGDYALRTQIIIRALNQKQEKVKDFRFKGVGVKTIAMDAFNMEAGDPIYLNITFIWNEFIPE